MIIAACREPEQRGPDTYIWVASIFGKPVPGGPLDNGAWLLSMDPRTQDPNPPVLVPIEVKNVRHWLYPNHWEIYQLLHKAAGLANAHPDYPMLPILICRKAHYRSNAARQGPRLSDLPDA